MEIVCPACGQGWRTADPGPSVAPRTCPECLHTWIADGRAAPQGGELSPPVVVECPPPLPDIDEPLLTDEVRTGLHPNPPPPPPPAPSLEAQQDRAFLMIGVGSTVMSVVVLLGAIGLLSGSFGGPPELDPGLVPARAAGRVVPGASLSPPREAAPAPAPRDTGWCAP